jgi:hypothetical protein
MDQLLENLESISVPLKANGARYLWAGSPSREWSRILAEGKIYMLTARGLSTFFATIRLRGVRQAA